MQTGTEIFDRAKKAIRRVVDINLGAVCRLVDQLGDLADTVALQEQAGGDEPSALACAPECSFCCHMRVVATVPEVILIGETIRNDLSESNRRDLLNRLIKLNEVTNGKSDEEWGTGGFACPLLVDGRCSVYEVRPLDCRAYNSTCKRACQAAAENYLEWDVPVNLVHQSTYKSAQAALLEGIENRGYRARLVEFVAALRIVLENRHAGEQWCLGQNTFESAEISYSDPEQLAFSGRSEESGRLPWTNSDSFRRDEHLGPANHQKMR